MESDLNAAVVAVIATCVVIWGLISGRLERWDVTAPIAFVVMGVVATHGPLTLVHVNLHSSTIRSLAELTLALVLFVDASRVNLRALRSDAVVPARLLGIGLPLTIAAGALVAAWLYGSSGLWLAAAIGAMVAPTDAALGASIMQDERVPSGVRRALNIESGLNDGIVTPVREPVPGRCAHRRGDALTERRSGRARAARRRRPRCRDRGGGGARVARRDQGGLERSEVPAPGRRRLWRWPSTRPHCSSA